MAKIKQIITSVTTTPATPFKKDLILETPVLISPGNGAVMCPRNADSTDSDIVLKWEPVAGANSYILALSHNSNFQGATVQAIKIADPTVEYDLKLMDDIRMGEEVFWRVNAIDGNGGTSEWSEIRSVKYHCDDEDVDPAGGAGEEGKRKGPGKGGGAQKGKGPKCKDFNVTMKITGPRSVLCCDRAAFRLDLEWDCKDQFGNNVVEYVVTAWFIRQQIAEGAGGARVTEQDDLSCKVKVNCKKSQMVTLTALVQLKDSRTLEEVGCSAEFDFWVDCDNKLEDKPWQIAYFDYSSSIIFYVHPKYVQDSISPTQELKKKESLLTVPILFGGDDTSWVYQYGGYPLKELQIPVDRMVAVGPIVRTVAEKFPTPEGPEPGTNPKCHQYIDPGPKVGQVLEANSHQAFGLGLKVGKPDGDGQPTGEVTPNCVMVHNEHLSGTEPRRRGIAAYGKVSLQVLTGCGVQIKKEKVQIKRSDLMGKGLVRDMRNGEPSSCGPNDPKPCGIQIYIGPCFYFTPHGCVYDYQSCDFVHQDRLEIYSDLHHVVPTYINGVVPGSLSLVTVERVSDNATDIYVYLDIEEFQFGATQCGFLVEPITVGAHVHLEGKAVILHGSP